MVQQPIQQCSGQCRVIGERRCPLAKRQVAGQDHATVFVPLGDHIKEQVGFIPTNGR